MQLTKKMTTFEIWNEKKKHTLRNIQYKMRILCVREKYTKILKRTHDQNPPIFFLYLLIYFI